MAYYDALIAAWNSTVQPPMALAAAAVTPWRQASTANGGGGLSSPVSGSDLVAAGNLT